MTLLDIRLLPARAFLVAGQWIWRELGLRVPGAMRVAIFFAWTAELLGADTRVGRRDDLWSRRFWGHDGA